MTLPAAPGAGRPSWGPKSLSARAMTRRSLSAGFRTAATRFDGLVVNAGAFTHTSLAILDALQSFDGPIVEVHLSNIFRREEFRHRSYVSQVATGVICGFRGQGYIMGVEALVALLTQNEQTDK